MADMINELRLDKTALSVTTLEAASEDRAYWASKTPDERLAALEVMRTIMYGYDPVTDRLQRLLKVVELGEG